MSSRAIAPSTLSAGLRRAHYATRILLRHSFDARTVSGGEGSRWDIRQELLRGVRARRGHHHGAQRPTLDALATAPEASSTIAADVVRALVAHSVDSCDVDNTTIALADAGL